MTCLRRICFVLATLTAVSLPANHAQGANLFVNLEGFGSLGGASVPDLGSAPTLIHYGGGGTLGFRLGKTFHVGATSDWRFIGQFSDVDVFSGNHRGTYLNPVSPAFGITLGQSIIQVDARILGSYDLEYPSASGGSLSFTSPMRTRISFSRPLSKRFRISVLYEFIKFRKQSDSISGESDQSKRFSNLGLGLTLELI